LARAIATGKYAGGSGAKNIVNFPNAKVEPDKRLAAD
jgi:hypothetical protein